ncbi:response regulator [Acidihalobacter aeolianus]|uniref:response regulator n=1 Tax=Acidihalobacter aeolianus TaxID=2792603 RepID=UPI0009F64F56|nr:response regulator transcription factor [Acidihalobacter aeolianus]
MSASTMPASSKPPARILIVDDHPIVREGIAKFLGLYDEFHVCCEASDKDSALAAMAECEHDLAIVDISLNGGSGLNLIKTLRQNYRQLAILTLSMHDEALFAERALRAGANGYLMKQEGTEHILSAVRQVLDGNVYLSAGMLNRAAQQLMSNARGKSDQIAGITEREFEILHLIALGFGTRDIAEKLNRSTKTIEAHRANLKDKLQLDSGRDLVRFAIQLLGEK